MKKSCLGQSAVSENSPHHRYVRRPVLQLHIYLWSHGSLALTIYVYARTCATYHAGGARIISADLRSYDMFVDSNLSER